MKKCLLCYELLDVAAQDEFHVKCSRKIFSTPRPPEVETSLADIKSIAKQNTSDRIAVAGVQAKVSIGLKVSKTNTGESNAPRRLTLGIGGQYLLKAPTTEFPYMVELEDLTMHLAEICKIKVASHGLIRLASGELAYITKRFDREGKEKLAQEDLCQLSGLLTEHKYNSSMEKIGKVIKANSDNSGLDAVTFFEVAVFSFLTGNADMHAKNFSLLTSKDGLTSLSPAYDLLATKFVTPDDPEESALPIHGKKSNLKREDFIALGETLEIPSAAIKKSISKFKANEGKMSALIGKSFVSDGLKRDFVHLVEERMARLVTALP